MEDRTEPKTASVFEVHLTLHGVYARSKDDVTKSFRLIVCSQSVDQLRRKIKQLNLPGTAVVKEAVICEENDIAHELHRQAKRENFDFKLVVVDETVPPPSP